MTLTQKKVFTYSIAFSATNFTHKQFFLFNNLLSYSSKHAFLLSKYDKFKENEGFKGAEFM